KSNKTTIDVKSTVVKEQAKSYKNHQNKETCRASTKHRTKEKPSYNKYSHNTKEDHSTKNSSTQTIVSPNLKTNTESHSPTERTPIYCSSFSEVIPELRRLKLSKHKSTIKSGETIQFELTGLDRLDNQIEIRDRISWSATAGKIDSRGLFSIDSKNDVVVTVTARVGIIKVSSTVNVESICELIEISKLASLKVLPDCIFIKPKEEQIFKALGFDRHNNQIDCGEIIWSATGGTIDQNGKLIVRNYAKGIYQVTATSKHTPKYNSAAKTTLLTLGVSTRILSWAIANEEFFYDVLAPLLNLTNDDDSLSETDVIVQGWIIEIGRRRIAKLLKKVSNLSFKETFSNISDSVDYIVLPELNKIQFINPPSKVQRGDRVQFKAIGFDQARDCINVDNQIIWTATSGLIDSQGIFIANSDTNSVEITAKVEGTNIKTKTKIKIEASFEEHYIESVKPEPLNNLSNSIKAVASKAREIVSNNNFHREKASEDSVNSKKPEKTSPPTDNTKPNTSTSTNEQEKKTETALESLNSESQSDSPNGSSSNTNSSDSNCNSLSNNSSINKKSKSFTNKSDGLTIYSPRFLIQAGQTKEFKIITGFDSKRCPIEYRGGSVTWKSTLGKVDSEGILKTPITFKDQYIEVSAKVNNIDLYYSFHTTGTHKYIFLSDYGYLPYISQSLDQLLYIGHKLRL
ncbi:MAG: hypothetical protein WBM44_07375, partial [Waterburya sp.]